MSDIEPIKKSMLIEKMQHVCSVRSKKTSLRAASGLRAFFSQRTELRRKANWRS